MQTLTGRRQSSPGDAPGSSSTRLVHGHHELDEIAVVSSNATPSQVKYGSGPLSAAANGPRIVPGMLLDQYIYKYKLTCIGLLILGI